MDPSPAYSDADVLFGGQSQHPEASGGAGKLPQNADRGDAGKNIKFILVLIFITSFIAADLYMIYWLVTQSRNHPGIVSFVGSQISPVADTSVPMPSPTATLIKYAPSLSSAHNNLGIKIFRNLVQTEKSNIIISPYSLAMTLTGISAIVSQSLSDNIASVFDLPGTAALSTGSPEIARSLVKADPDLPIRIYRSLWITPKYPLTRDQQKYLTGQYNFSIKQMSNNPKQSALFMNNWISQQTEGAFKTAISDLPQDASLSAILAGNFTLLWQKGFSNKFNGERDFFSEPEKPVSSEFMRKEQTDLEYYETDQIQVVSLPLGKTGRLTANLILPKNNLNDLAVNLNEQLILEWISGVRPKPGIVFVPKINVSYGTDLKNQLLLTGLTGIWNREIELIGKVEGSGVYNLTSYIKMNLDETGIKEGDTSIITIPKSENPFYMELNKPFFIVIHDKVTQEIILLAAINQILTTPQ